MKLDVRTPTEKLVAHVAPGNWFENEWGGFDYKTENPNLTPVAVRLYVEDTQFVLVRFTSWAGQELMWKAEFSAATPLPVIAAAMAAALAPGVAS